MVEAIQLEALGVREDRRERIQRGLQVSRAFAAAPYAENTRGPGLRQNGFQVSHLLCEAVRLAGRTAEAATAARR